MIEAITKKENDKAKMFEDDSIRVVLPTKNPEKTGDDDEEARRCGRGSQDNEIDTLGK